MVKIQTEDFDLTRELASIKGQSKTIGAIVTFTGLVRDFSENRSIQAMTLEHYPGMTESTLHDIADKAVKRWGLEDIVIIHRHGTLRAGDQIVLVAAASKHRQDAFDAAQYIMDYLKTDAPFWKKEHTDNGDHWVESRESDTEAKLRWKQ